MRRHDRENRPTGSGRSLAKWRGARARRSGTSRRLDNRRAQRVSPSLRADIVISLVICGGSEPWLARATNRGPRLKHMVKLIHKPISNQRSIIPRSTRSMEGGTETALTLGQASTLAIIWVRPGIPKRPQGLLVPLEHDEHWLYWRVPGRVQLSNQFGCFGCRDRR